MYLNKENVLHLNQKDFALSVKHFPYSGTLFALRAKKVSSVKESLQNTSITKLEKLLNIDYNIL